jgi:UDP-N-acetylmuramoyl-tripeptide--D-alanyl-D-alanine ligase
MQRTLGVRTLSEFARACGGRLHGADRSFFGVSTDTRTLSAGELFVALRGPNFNGNEFAGAAQAAGAAGAVVDSRQDLALSQVVVADVQRALEQASSRWRDAYRIPIVGVAGSNGKTTVKEMTAQILGQVGACLSTRGNLNNHIGVPLTLLRLEQQHRFAVVEMGANRAGEVAALVVIAKPTIGLITNAGAEHLEGFGSLEGVARAEGEMVAGLSADAVAVINADDEFAELWRKSTRARVVTFGVSESADFRAANVRVDSTPDGFITSFTLICPLGEAEIELQLAGQHNVSNALAAAAAAAAAGASLDNIVAGLAAMRAVRGRLQLKTARNGAWIIDDSYNANPSSVRAGIEVLAQLEGRKWMVLGGMGELGEFTDEAHVEAGAYAREHGIEKLFTLGPLASLAADSFGAGAVKFADAESLARALDSQADAGVRLLIKGSRFNRLERVVEALVKKVPSTDQATKG